MIYKPQINKKAFLKKKKKSHVLQSYTGCACIMVEFLLKAVALPPWLGSRCLRCVQNWITNDRSISDNKALLLCVGQGNRYTLFWHCDNRVTVMGFVWGIYRQYQERQHIPPSGGFPRGYGERFISKAYWKEFQVPSTNYIKVNSIYELSPWQKIKCDNLPKYVIVLWDFSKHILPKQLI